MSPDPSFPAHRTWAEIDLNAISSNLAAIRRHIGPEPEILAVVKADAYGHGAHQVALAIASQVDSFGVANLEEALPLAESGKDILLLGPCLPHERAGAVAAGLIPVVSSTEEARAFAACGSCRVNLKIDTGMGRVGCRADQALRELEAILAIPGITVHSISTHLPVADEDEGFTQSQLTNFRTLKTELLIVAPTAKFHVLNSAGILGFPGEASDIVRAGLAIYGSASPPHFQNLLRPALEWKARVALVSDLPAGATVSYGREFTTPRPMRLACIPVGYADGFPRQASGRRAEVLIGGRRRPVVGRVTMDQVMVDVTVAPAPEPGDEVVIIGGQGGEEILVAELASKSGTIAWDVLAGIGGRVTRVYRELIAASGDRD